MMLSIVIPFYNNPDSVRRLLRSIYKQFDSSKGEVIAVDDGSTYAKVDLLKEEFPGLNLIKLNANAGAANARNAGVKMSSHGVILFLDSDMELDDGAISGIENNMADPKVNAVVGTVRDTPINRGLFQDYWALLKSYFHSLPKRYSSTFYPMLGAIRKAAFEDVGGFDAKIRRASIEDYEFSMRFINKGYKVLYDPKIIAGTQYKDFFTSISQSIERAKKWGILFLEKRSFDNHTTTASQGIASILGFMTVVLTVIGCFNNYFLAIATACFVALLYINRGFFVYVLRRRGVIFTVISSMIYTISSFFITLGFFQGALYIFRNRRCRKEALYA